MDLVKQIREMREKKDTANLVKNLNSFKSDIQILKSGINDLKVRIKSDVAKDKFVAEDFFKLSKLFEERQLLQSKKPDIKAAIEKLKEVSLELGN